MITATGNNFGAYTIQLKDYQSDKMVVLNGRFELNPESEEYQAAQQLEIYVPDLSIPKSTMTASAREIVVETDGHDAQELDQGQEHDCDRKAYRPEECFGRT